MKYIYYPEFELENRGLLDYSPNHILNLKILLFLCDKIILHPSHISNTKIENIFFMGKQLKDFFNAGKIVTTIYYKDIAEYYNIRLDQVNEPFKKKERIQRAKLIVDNLFFNPSVVHFKGNELNQVSAFDNKVKTALKESIENGPNKKTSILLLNELNEISNKTGNFIYSNQLQEVLVNSRDDKKILKPQYKYYLDLMSVAYYSSSLYVMDTIISYTNYFDKINFQKKIIEKAYVDIKNAPNMIIDPVVLLGMFQIFGISESDILKLSVKDYDEIKAHKSWKAFVDLFNDIYKDAREIDNLLNSSIAKNNKFEKIKKSVYKCFNVATLSLFVPISLINVSAWASIGIPFLLTIMEIVFARFVKKHTTDNIVDILEKINNPLYAFSLKLKKVINENK